MAKCDPPSPLETPAEGLRHGSSHPAGAWQDAELAELLRIWPVLELSERRALLGFIRHIIKGGPDPSANG